MRFGQDDRGLALGLVAFFGMIVLGALLFILMNSGVSELFTITSNTAETTGGSNQIDGANVIWQNLLFYVLFLALIFIIARAVREGQRT